jgi:hypothetical protein
MGRVDRVEKIDWKNFLLSLGVGLVCAGIPTMLMEHFAYLTFGLLIVTIGVTCIGLAIFIKPNDYYFWDYLERMSLFALKESRKTTYNAHEEIYLKRFIDVVSKGISCYYLPEKSNQIKDTFKKICLFHKKRNPKDKTKRMTETYEKLWAYLTTFYEFRHESVFCNPNFNPKELERFEIYEKKKNFIESAVEKIKNQ